MSWNVRPVLQAVLLAMGVTVTQACTDNSQAPATDPTAVAYPWQLPAGFPSPVVPPDNPMTVEKARLGRFLFYDTRLSVNGTVACASCHHQVHGFSDPHPQPYGAHGEFIRRNAMALTNAAYNAAYTWANPMLRTLEEQALVPMFSQMPAELAMADHESEILARFSADGRYPGLFHAAFPSDPAPVSIGNVVKALASFERTLISANSAYDRSLRGDATALTPGAQRGRDLFFGERLECYHCHGQFNLTDSYVRAGSPTVQLSYHNNGLYNVDGQGAYPASDQGLYEITHQPADMGRFRAPTLRNIALSAPYMHDGSIATLEDVLAAYGTGGRVITTGPNAGNGSLNPHKDSFVLGFTLTAQEQSDVLEFLRALTDWSFVSDPRLSDPFLPTPPPTVCADPGMGACTSPMPSYATDIAPLIDSRCGACHRGDAPGARWLLSTHDTLTQNGADVAGQVRNCLMPPPESPQFTSAERQRLLAWIACGSPDN